MSTVNPSSLGVCSKRFIGTLEPIEQENLVEFRILYKGELKASGNRSAVENKHDIRKFLHPQLLRQWKTNKALRQLSIQNSGAFAQLNPNATEEERVIAGINALGAQQSMHGFNWLPVSMKGFGLRCSLDILLLRPEGEVPVHGKQGETFIINNGDIDGQLKTLLDALRIPDQPQELPPNSAPTSEQMPFCCLLHNDQMISEIKVTAAPLLLLPAQTQVMSNEAFVLIHVKINHDSPRTFDNYWG